MAMFSASSTFSTGVSDVWMATSELDCGVDLFSIWYQCVNASAPLLDAGFSCGNAVQTLPASCHWAHATTPTFSGEPMPSQGIAISVFWFPDQPIHDDAVEVLSTQPEPSYVCSEEYELFSRTNAWSAANGRVCDLR